MYNPFFLEGLDRKIVVYDELAPNIPTRRLFAQLKSVARRLDSVPPPFGVLEKSEGTELFLVKMSLAILKKHWKELKPAVRGLEFLDLEDEETQFVHLGGQYPNGDEHLILGVTRGGFGLLGSF